MKTKSEHFARRAAERGNALVYVLIAIVLFAALSMVLGRSTSNSEISTLSDERAQIEAGRIIAYAGQVKSSLDQMEFSGTKVSAMEFIMPHEAGFDTEPPPNIRKVYHPVGGGITPGTLADEVIASTTTSNPAPGWYMGRFNNIDWTPLGPGNTSGAGGAEAPFMDVVLVAYQLSQQICAKINTNLTGAATIPVMTDTARNVFIDDDLHSGTNVDLSTGGGQICPDCHNKPSLCVQDSGGEYAFYTIAAQQ